MKVSPGKGIEFLNYMLPRAFSNKEYYKDAIYFGLFSYKL